MIAPGTRLGAYEILALLGAGGMGEVYRAHDARLNRFVAVKILPGTAALDAERRDRFTREAQSIAALNHLNIVTIFSIEDVEEHSLITMELVEGQTLADKIAQVLSLKLEVSPLQARGSGPAAPCLVPSAQMQAGPFQVRLRHLTRRWRPRWSSVVAAKPSASQR